MHAINAANRIPHTDNWPAAAIAPATSRIGVAGIGKPICSTNTLRKIAGNPYWVIKVTIS